MKKNRLITHRLMLFVCAIMSLYCAPMSGEEIKTDKFVETNNQEVLIKGADYSLENSHFTWGVDVGTSIDVGAYDLSTIDVDFNIGYKNKMFKTVGIMAGVHRNFDNGTYYIPLTVLARINVNSTNPWSFLQMHMGYSFNTVGEIKHTGAFTFGGGIGFRIAHSRSFSSHIALTYSYMRLGKSQQLMIDKRRRNVDVIQVRLGVNF